MSNEELMKSTVIGNIQNMRAIAGMRELSYEYLDSKSYEWLHNEQIKTISHYNEAIRNKLSK